MNFRIADTFTDSLARLTGEEQKAVKTTAFDLQMNPANPAPGLRFHKLDKCRDKRFWSVSVNMDIRLIVHRSDDGLMLCYVDHHDAAYRWAERRKLETHPKTGAAQLIELREKVREIEIVRHVEATPAETKPATKAPLFADVPDETLLRYGVPEDWLTSARQVDEDGLLSLVDHLPSEAGEALLALAVGEQPQTPAVVAPQADPFEHPDAQRRFRLVASSDELQRALDYPWERWAVFLHPAQREVVKRRFAGPARVAGSAGTGKTVVALHRSVELALEYPDERVLLTTFSIPLARMLRTKLMRLIEGDREIADRILVRALDEVGLEVYEQRMGKPRVATTGMLRQLIKQASDGVPDARFPIEFLIEEWSEVIDAWQLGSWSEYRDVPRLGRKTRLGEKQRAVIWRIAEQVRADLVAGGLVTMPAVFSEVTRTVVAGDASLAQRVVVDEAQDVTIPQLRFLAALGARRQDGLFFAGDLGQRIFQTPFSWKALGVDVRGRSSTLRVNYRMSHQIRGLADRLLSEAVADVDGNLDERRGTVSAFRGPEPTILLHEDEAAEVQCVASWLRERQADGLRSNEIGIFVRSDAELKRAMAAVRSAALQPSTLGEQVERSDAKVSVGTMHDAKGLEFRAVAVMACDEDVVPLASRIESLADPAEVEVIYETERHLLYVACTRARDHLLVTGVEPGSEFIEDLK